MQTSVCTLSVKMFGVTDFWVETSSKFRPILATLESGIDVGQLINVGPGIFGKKNKGRALNTHVLYSK